MHLNSELLFRKYATPLFKNNLKVLEIGPSGHPSSFQTIIGNPSITWHTMDFASSTFIANANDKLTYVLESPCHFPIESSSYDVVLSGQVIEHVEKIWDWIKEIKRILRVGGVVITLNPVSWPYHEAPIDCWRIFPNAIKALASNADLDVEIALFESLEAEQLKLLDPKATFVPGQSYNYQKAPSHHLNIMRWNRFIRMIPNVRRFQIPIEVAFDTFSVLKKSRE